MRVAQQLLFVRGGGKGVHDDWDNKLVDSLRRELRQRCEVNYPRMPNENGPSYAAWKTALGHELESLKDDDIVSLTRWAERRSSSCSQSAFRPEDSAPSP